MDWLLDGDDDELKATRKKVRDWIAFRFKGKKRKKFGATKKKA